MNKMEQVIAILAASFENGDLGNALIEHGVEGMPITTIDTNLVPGGNLQVILNCRLIINLKVSVFKRPATCLCDGTGICQDCREAMVAG